MSPLTPIVQQENSISILAVYLLSPPRKQNDERSS